MGGGLTRALTLRAADTCVHTHIKQTNKQTNKYTYIHVFTVADFRIIINSPTEPRIRG